MAIGILIGLLGLILMVSGLARTYPKPPEPSALPTARIENGSALPPTLTVAPRSGVSAVRLTIGILLMLIGGGVALFAYALGTLHFSHGRPVRVGRRPRVGSRARGTGWHDDARPRTQGMGAWRCARQGERWLAAARAEHASVPAFRRLEAQLVALNAPAELVRRCRAAAADEVRHARRCFALARAYSGIDWTAGTLRIPDDEAVELSGVALESLVDGCVGEGIAADLANAGAQQALDPVIKESLAMIAVDEAAHAELAWDVLAFCLDRGGAEIEQALLDELPGLSASASPGPTGVSHATCKQLSRARLARVQERLSAMIAVRAECN